MPGDQQKQRHPTLGDEDGDEDGGAGDEEVLYTENASAPGQQQALNSAGFPMNVSAYTPLNDRYYSELQQLSQAEVRQQQQQQFHPTPYYVQQQELQALPQYQSQYSSHQHLEDDDFQPQAQQSSPTNRTHNLMGDSLHSSGSIQSLSGLVVLSDIDLRVLLQMVIPPRNVVLASAMVVILLAKGQEIPADASWHTFQRLARSYSHVSLFADAINSISPNVVSTFKRVALQHMLDTLFYGEAEEERKRPLPMKGHGPAATSSSQTSLTHHETVAVRKLLGWLRQVRSWCNKLCFKWICQQRYICFFFHLRVDCLLRVLLSFTSILILSFF